MQEKTPLSSGSDQEKLKKDTLNEIIRVLGSEKPAFARLRDVSYSLNKIGQIPLRDKALVATRKATIDEMLTHVDEINKDPWSFYMHLLHTPAHTYDTAYHVKNKDVFQNDLGRLLAIAREAAGDYPEAAELYENLNDNDGAERTTKLEKEKMTNAGSGGRKERVERNKDLIKEANELFLNKLKGNPIMQIDVEVEIEKIKAEAECLLAK
jgi:hypothetical protein